MRDDRSTGSILQRRPQGPVLEERPHLLALGPWVVVLTKDDERPVELVVEFGPLAFTRDRLDFSLAARSSTGARLGHWCRVGFSAHV